VIALWLGHESIETTQVYLDADLEMKQRILEDRGAGLRALPVAADARIRRDQLLERMRAVFGSAFGALCRACHNVDDFVMAEMIAAMSVRRQERTAARLGYAIPDCSIRFLHEISTRV
jgi:hypothetical protein